MDSYQDNYLKYRGKCKEFAEELARNSGGKLTVVWGYYYEPMWSREEAHFWCVDTNGTIYDPTKKQFPSNGVVEFYREFDGIFQCEHCGSDMKELDAKQCGRFVVCSTSCACRLVGV